MARYRRDVIVTIVGVGTTLAVLNLVLPKDHGGAAVVAVVPPAHAARDCGVTAAGNRRGRAERPPSARDPGAAAKRCALAAD